MVGTRPPSLLLSGRLEAIALADVLQLVANAGRDGRLCVEREHPPEYGEIELVRGRVVRASIEPAAPRLGRLLVDQGRLADEVLGEALERQSGSAPWRPLGSVLLEMGALDSEALASALAEQIEFAVSTMLAWREGVFRFRDWSASTESGLAPEVGIALEPHEILLTSARRLDEGRNTRRERVPEPNEAVTLSAIGA